MLRAAVLVAIVTLAARADADPARAWAAAKANLPASTTALMGMNVDGFLASSLGAFATPLIMSLDAKHTLDAIKKECGFEPLKAIDALVLASGATTDSGVLYLALDGVDQAAVLACTDKLVKGGGKPLHLTWFGSDVVAIAQDDAMLKALTSGKGAFAKTPLGKLAAKVDTAATIWVASSKPRQVQGKTLKAGYGTLAIANGMVSADARLTFASARDAAAVAKDANEQITALLASGRLDASVMAMLVKVSIVAKGAEMVATGALADADVMPLLAAMKP